MYIRRWILFSFIVYSFITCSDNTSDQDYIEYYQKINVAESLIGSSDYGKAFAIYDELIKTYPEHSCKDLHNACVCALQLKKYKEALSLAFDLVNHGYELEDFDSQPFDNLRNQKKYWNQFLSAYPRLRKQYEKNLDIPLRNEYQALFEIDQQAATTRNGVWEQDSVFYGLAVSVSKLIKEQGFPHWMQNKDTIIPHIYVMLRHYCGLENRKKYSKELQEDSLYIRMTDNDIPLLCKQALHNGLIAPDWYEHIVTYWDNNNPYGTPAIMIDFNTEKVFPFLQADTEKIPEINNRRIQIGLSPLTGELSDSLLNSTWYKCYPFQKIKEVFLSCDTCHSVEDFMDILREYETIVKNEFLQENDKNFILNDLTNDILDFHYMGVKTIVDLKLKKNGTITQ